MPASRNGSVLLRLSLLSQRSKQEFSLRPDTAARGALAAELGLTAIRKLRFEGTLKPQGRRDWVLDATLGATVVQPCRVTLEPVTTRIDERVVRRYLAEAPPPPETSEAEIPEDDSIESLPETLHLDEVMAEALALAVPAFPRAEGAAPGNRRVAEPGITPLDDKDLKPFASLANLRDRLSDPD